MHLRQWFRPPRHLGALYGAITLVLVCAFGWLSWRLLEQDRAIQSQRIQERLDHAADVVAAALARSLDSTEQRLTEYSSLPDAQLSSEAPRYAQQLAHDALIVVLRPQTLESYPNARLLFYPFEQTDKEAPASVFAEGEKLEFRQKDYGRAIEAFRRLARSKEASIRTGALLRLARNLRKAGQLRAALAAYDELARLGSTPVGKLPADLLARHARCVLLAELKQPAELRFEARALDNDLDKGHWRLTSAAYSFYKLQTRQWLAEEKSGEAHLRPGFAVAAGVESLWEEWQHIRRGESNPSGRRSLWLHDQPVFLLWRGTRERLVALVAGPQFLRHQFLDTSEALVERQNLRWALTDAEGHGVLGSFGGTPTRQAVRTAADSQLPWTLHVASADPRVDLAEFAVRRRLLFAGLAMMATLMMVGSYFIARSVSRELEVARLQSDFVSAVSHEFRTPLASLRQLSELLVDGRVPDEQRRLEYYRGLNRESERLDRLVETLLDFGRMEAGAREYCFELLNAAELVRGVAEEFEREQEVDEGFELQTRLSEGLPFVRADREALGRALWNLLDNAVKYSRGSKCVWLEAAGENGRVAIRVRDQGLGIAPSEQKKIFKKFVRAESARSAGVKGTGLGLAMVKHIVTAHRGEVRVESRLGAGSTFTIFLPPAKG